MTDVIERIAKLRRERYERIGKENEFGYDVGFVAGLDMALAILKGSEAVHCIRTDRSANE